MRNQKGFTLIELIIVIVVLGILAVTAAPQFIDFSSDARTSTVKGLKGAIQGASNVTYGKSSLDGENTLAKTETPAPSADGITTSYGYPTANGDGIIAAMQIDASAQKADDTADFVYLVDGGNNTIYIVPTDQVTTEDTGELASTATYTDTSCYVQYTEATGVGTAAKFTIDVVSSGC